MRKLVLAIGNDIMGDDGVSFRVIENLKRTGITGVDMEKAYADGMDAAVKLIGYDYAVVIDASKKIPPGDLAILSQSAAPVNKDSPHSLSFFSSVQFLKECGEKMPEIRMVSVGVKEIKLGIGLSRDAEDAAEGATYLIKTMLEDEK